MAVCRFKGVRHIFRHTRQIAIHIPAGRKMSQTPSEAEAKRKIVFWIVMGIVAWGIVLAIGDYLKNHDPRRPLIIIAGVVLFVGFWLAMLRTRRSDETPTPPE
jgi:hypothetical protein